MNLQALTAKIREVCPIDGVSESGTIWFQDAATEQQRADARALFDNWEDPPEQNWGGFMDGAATVNGFYAAIAGSAMASLITARMVRLAGGEEFKGATDPLISSWNAAPPVLNATQRSELQALANTHNIPAAIGEDNRLTAT